jgi:hypothetical protein
VTTKGVEHGCPRIGNDDNMEEMAEMEEMGCAARGERA